MIAPWSLNHHARKLAILACVCLVAAPATWAQLSPAPPKPPMSRMERNDLLRAAPTHTFYPKYATQASDANEIYTALRNALDPDVKSFLVASQKAIIIRGLPDDIALATHLSANSTAPATPTA